MTIHEKRLDIIATLLGHDSWSHGQHANGKWRINVGDTKLSFDTERAMQNGILSLYKRTCQMFGKKATV